MSSKFIESLESPSAPSSSNQPPPYPASANNRQEGAPLNSTENLSLIIEGERVFSTVQPNRTLYHLSQPVLAGKWVVIGIEKVLYRVKDDEPPGYDWVDEKKENSSTLTEEERSQGHTDVRQENEGAENPSLMPAQTQLNSKEIPDERSRRRSMLDIGPAPPRSPSPGPRIVHRKSHIYDIRRSYFESLGESLIIEGKSRKCYKEINLRRLPGSSSWKARLDEEEWKVSQSRNAWEWKGKSGKPIAVEEEQETFVTGGNEGGKQPVRRARMDIKTELAEKETDFLVAAWVARVGAEAQERVKEPLTWDKCECSSTTTVVFLR
jgi:hypothetical protein